MQIFVYVAFIIPFLLVETIGEEQLHPALSVNVDQKAARVSAVFGEYQQMSVSTVHGATAQSRTGEHFLPYVFFCFLNF